MPVNTLHFSQDSSSAVNGESHFSATDLFNLMRDHVWTIVGSVAVAVALAIAYVTLATPVYSADVMVRVDTPEPNALGLSAINQQNPPAPADASTGSAELEVMQSRSVLDPVIQGFGFDVSVTPKSFPILSAISKKFAKLGQPSSPWLGLTSFAWGGEIVHIGSLEVPQSLENEPLKLIAQGDDGYELLGPSGETLLTGTAGKPAASNGVSMSISRLVARPGTEFKVVRWNLLDAVDRFKRDMKVTSKGKGAITSIVQLTYHDENPWAAADVANALARQYIASAVESRQRDDSKTLDFINQELPRVRAELARTEESLSTYQSSSRSLEPTTEADAYLKGGLDFQKQIATLQIQRTQLLLKYTPDSPWIRNIDEQIEQLQNRKSTFDTRFSDMPASQRKNADLTRDAKVAEAVYVEMVNKKEQLTVRRASTTGGAHIVDVAQRPRVPVRPNRMLVIPAAAGLGLFIGAFLVFMRRHVMTGVTDPFFVERSLSVPVFGEVLYSEPQALLEKEIAWSLNRGGSKGGNLLSYRAVVPNKTGNPISDPRLTSGQTRVLADRFRHDLSVEALRTVRTALNRNSAHAHNNIVMFTGPTPYAGKSFVAVNIAVLQAEIGSRVLLIDADMRRGHLAAHFNQSNHGGLSEVLAGSLQPSEVIRGVGVNGLSFMSCGSYPANPAELLMGRGFKALLSQVSDQFDMVIIDTPPFLAVTDPAIVASEAGATVLVLRSGMQSEAEIAETVKKLERADARIFGAVFNAIPLRWSNRHYGYASAYTTNFKQFDGVN
ncbi:polysaccharide biosynthesis tyrosine autokinase [Caballeronia sordidicola]|uniref:polysaccharide biosynthesis tyrosine autokinase n=1 Tax=Caballeronia sordidicola TaxID=196367 RepID=UPI0009DCF36D